MKNYKLENMFVLFEEDETTGERKFIGSGDDGNEYNRFYSLTNEQNDLHTLYIPRDDGSVFTIEDVCSFDDDYEDDGFILYQKENLGDTLNFAYLFEENRILELGTEEEDFYINNEDGKKLAAYISNNELIYFSFISYFILSDEYFFEIETGKFRIFSTNGYDTEEKTEEPFYSADDEKNGVTIFFEREGELYREIIRTENQIDFYNAYLKQDEISGNYELYGFKDGKPFLLGSGKIFQEINYNIRLDNLIWRMSSDDDWLLEYEPEEYKEPEPEPEYKQETQEIRQKEEQTDSPEQKTTVHGLDDSRYFSARNQSEKEKKPWWKIW